MRSPSDETLDPQIAYELEMIEAELGPDLEALRPALEQEFGHKLDAWAAEGFPGAEGRAGRLRRRVEALRRRRVLLPALAGATALVIVGTVVVSSLGGGGDADHINAVSPTLGVEQGQSAAGGQLQRPSARSAADQSAETATGASGSAGAAAAGLPAQPGLRRRQIERSAQIVLGTDPEHVQQVSGGVFDTVRRYGGIVLSSSVRDGTQGDAGASFELLFPSFRLGDALGDLSGLAEVRSRNEGTLDITKPFVTVREHLRDARAEAAGLLRQLGSATTKSERDSLKAQLRRARARIARLGAREGRIQRRADFSRVSLSVTTGEPVSPLQGSGSGGWSLGDAAHDAGKVLSTAAGVVLVGLAVLVPIALLAGLAWAAWRVLVRRARDGALG
jgi:hypothetical protein